jgi:hypothetical protein
MQEQMRIRDLIVLNLFRLLRKYQTMRRSLFKGSLPHWVRDSVELIKYVNLVGPLITLSAIAFSPDHFFDRLPQYISRKDSWFGSPIKFFTQGVALMATLTFFIGDNLQRILSDNNPILDRTLTPSRVYWTVMVYALLAPLYVPLISVLLSPLGFLNAMISSGFSAVAPSRKSIIRGGLFGFKLMLISVMPSTYARIRWTRFFWSLFYYDVYFFLVTFIVLAPVTIIVSIMVEMILLDNDNIAMKVLHLTFVGMVYMGPVVLLIISPYWALLKSALASPPKVIIMAMYNQIATTVSDITNFARNKTWDLLDDDKVLDGLESLIHACETTARRELKLNALREPGARELYLNDRREVLAEVLSTLQLRTLLAARTAKSNERLIGLLDRIDSISTGT